MKNEIQLSGQVLQFLAGLAPDQKKKLRTAMRCLETDAGDLKDLVDALTGYKRLRVGNFRVIYLETFKNGRPVRECIFGERRNVVYELFSEMVLSDLT
jgi:mRNA-degrading endonuclease RelE of RelBE toxin-antitoxin system